MDKKQQMRYSDSELNLIKNTFENRDELLKAIRKIMLGCEISETELTMVRDIYSGAMSSLFEKMFLPTVSGNEPIGQTIDLWMTIDVKDRDPLMADLNIRARAELIKLIVKGLKQLEQNKPFRNATSFKVSDDARQEVIDLMVRNTYISHVEQRLLELKSLASMSQETEEEKRERAVKNSLK